MHLTERSQGDVEELRRRAGEERDALRRDRYRAVLLALDGEEAVEIARALGRARRSVQDWAYPRSSVKLIARAIYKLVPDPWDV